jgi:hypothetical protein
LGFGDDEHYPAGLENHGWLSWVIRLIGVHLFRFLFSVALFVMGHHPLPNCPAGIPPFGFSYSCLRLHGITGVSAAAMQRQCSHDA